MCKNCGAPVTDDGHGEAIHVVDNGLAEAYRYGCKPGRVRENEAYPVAA